MKKDPLSLWTNPYQALRNLTILLMLNLGMPLILAYMMITHPQSVDWKPVVAIAGQLCLEGFFYWQWRELRKALKR